MSECKFNKGGFCKIPGSPGKMTCAQNLGTVTNTRECHSFKPVEKVIKP
jgi:hypothetical protein